MSRKQRRIEDAEYRKLLKARLKFDKMVKPKGEKAEPAKREPKLEAPPKPALTPAPPAEIKIDAFNNTFIADHYDDNPDNPMVLMAESEFYGVFNFRDTVLDQLDRYWFYLDRMRKYDADSYGFYKQYGAQLIPYLANSMIGKATTDEKIKFTAEMLARYRSQIILPPMFNAKRPMFGCIAYGANPKAEEWEKTSKWLTPRFLYFHKYSKPAPEIQRKVGGDMYKMTVWWDRSDNKRCKWGVPTEYGVWISEDGHHIQVLKTCEMRWHRVQEKHSLRRFRIPDRQWRMPDEFKVWAKQHGLDVQTHLSHVFTEALHDIENAQFGDVRVQVHNVEKNMTAVFGIDSRRMAYFFKDRDYDSDGRRERIFHIVAPYTRKDGTAVKMHYRGVQDFTWAGYDVHVTVPGLHHFHQEEFNVGAIDSYWLKPGEKFVTEPELAARLLKKMKEQEHDHSV